MDDCLVDFTSHNQFSQNRLISKEDDPINFSKIVNFFKKLAYPKIPNKLQLKLTTEERER